MKHNRLLTVVLPRLHTPFLPHIRTKSPLLCRSASTVADYSVAVTREYVLRQHGPECLYFIDDVWNAEKSFDLQSACKS
jgi:hypothetical protein